MSGTFNLGLQWVVYDPKDMLLCQQNPDTGTCPSLMCPCCHSMARSQTVRGLQPTENPMWFLKARYNGLTQRKWRSKGDDDFRLMYCIPYISALRCGPRKRFITLEGAQSLRIQRLHTYRAPSLSLVSVFPIAFPLGKPRLNTLHGLVPERSALFSAKGVLKSFFPVSNYAHGTALSAHNE